MSAAVANAIRSRRATGLAAALLLLLATAPCGLHAQSGAQQALPVPADRMPTKEFNALMSFIAANPACQSFADGCQICRRITQNQIACSTPGIACHKGEWTCQASEPATPPDETPSGIPYAQLRRGNVVIGWLRPTGQ